MSQEFSERATERLSHFKCKVCRKWWSVGDAPAAKEEWFCPWCGTAQRFKEKDYA